MLSFRLTGLVLLLIASTVDRLCADELFALPEDPRMPVIELWYVDDTIAESPEVSVFANGRVRVRVGDGDIWGELTVERTAKLARTLLETDALAEITTDSLKLGVQQESSRTGLSAEIDGAGDTIICIRTANASYRVDGHAVGLLSTRFPNVRSLQHLYSAQRRLENVRAIVMVGGTEAADKLARFAEARVAEARGAKIPVTAEDLSLVRSLADGTRYCQFVVRSSEAPGAAEQIISLVESPGAVPRVSLLNDGPRQQ